MSLVSVKMARSRVEENEREKLICIAGRGWNRQFLGEVRLKDVLALRKAGNHDLSSIVMKEVPSVLENTTVEDMLPLLPEIRQALPVVNEANQLAGLVSTSSIIIEMTGKDKEEIDQIVQNAIEL